MGYAGPSLAARHTHNQSVQRFDTPSANLFVLVCHKASKGRHEAHDISAFLSVCSPKRLSESNSWFAFRIDV